MENKKQKAKITDKKETGNKKSDKTEQKKATASTGSTINDPIFENETKRGRKPIEKKEDLNSEEKVKTTLDVTKDDAKVSVLSRMSFSEISALLEILNQNVLKNNYAGGDVELKTLSNDLIIKINEEIKNRIKTWNW